MGYYPEEAKSGLGAHRAAIGLKNILLMSGR
jgi:hypothetical protein